MSGRGARPRVPALCAAVAALACSGTADAPTSAEPALVVVTGATLPSGTVGEPYDVTLQATGGNGQYTWHVMNTPLPDGLALSERGRLAGTPVTPATMGLTVRVMSGSQTRITGFLLSVAPPPLEITPHLLANATLGVAYSQFLEVIGGSGPIQWTLASGALPGGLSLSQAGLLAGTPTALDSAAFRVRAARGSASVERSYSLRVVPAPLVISTSTLPPAKVGDPYRVLLEHAGGSGTAQWQVIQGALPPGLQLAGTGAIEGTPTTSGDHAFTAEVSSGAQRASRSLTLTVMPAGYPATATVTMPGNVFVPLLVQIARGGTVTWVFGAAPHNVIFAATPGAPADINIVSDVSVARTFPIAGTFRYDCTIHPGMSGVVDVKP